MQGYMSKFIGGADKLPPSVLQFQNSSDTVSFPSASKLEALFLASLGSSYRMPAICQALDISLDTLV